MWPGLGCTGVVGVELPGERNVACLVPPGTETGDFKDGVGAGEGSPAGDFSLGSRARGGSGGPLGNLVGERMLSLARSGLVVECLSKPGCVGGAPASRESLGEIWGRGRSPGEVDNTCANLEGAKLYLKHYSKLKFTFS